MKKIIKAFLLGVLISTLFISTVLGSGVKETIEVVFNSINLKVNDDDVIAENILYEGTTYVPLREVSEMLGKHVNWNSDTRTAIISDDKKTNDDIELKSIDFSELHFDKGNFERTYFDSMFSNSKVKVRNEEFPINNGMLLSSHRYSTASYVLDNEFKKLTGYFACNDDNHSAIGNTKYNSSFIQILGDDMELHRQVAYRGEKPQYFEIDIRDIDTLKFNGGRIVDTVGKQAHFGGVLIDLKLWK